MNWKERAEPVDGKTPGGWRSRAVAPESVEEAGPETSAGEAAYDHFRNTATLGYLPQLEGLAAKMTPNPNADLDEKLRNEGFKIIQDEPDYLSARDSALERLAKQSEEHPIASKIGMGAGILGSAAIPLGAAAKGATLGAKALQGAKSGALMGAIANPGDKENEIDPVQIGGRLQNAAIGGAIGAAAPVAIDKASKASKSVGEYLRKKAALKATRALGRPTPTQATRMAQTGQDETLGRELLDADAIPVLGTPGRISGRVDALKEKAGQEIGDLVDSAGGAKLVDSEKLAIEILDSPEIAQMRNTPGMESTVAAIEKQVETLANNGQLTLKEAQALRQGIDKSINFNKGAPEMRGAQEGLYKQRTAIRDAMNDAIDSLPDATGKDSLKKANRRYGNLSEASDILEREIGRNQANRSISLTDTIAAAGGVASGNPVAPLALGALNKFGRTFGNSMQARVFDAISKKASEAAPSLAKASATAASIPAIRAATEAGNEFEREDDPYLNNPRLMKLFKDDPGLIDKISDERTKAKIRRAIAGKKGK